MNVYREIGLVTPDVNKNDAIYGIGYQGTNDIAIKE
jgi:hypothetical protein